MRRRLVTYVLAALWSGCTCSDVTIAPPRVVHGGRAIAIAVTSTNEKRLLVATESGGLFRTFDGGVSWQHLGGFPTFRPIDVEIASLAPDVMLATARDDFRSVSGGGIWRSADGGGTWRRPNGWPPPSSPGCKTRPEAWEMSHMPLSRTFYVATDCGLAMSTDDGATFSLTILDPSAPMRFDSLQNRVRSVLVVNRSVGVAADDTRLWFLRGGQWTPSTVAPDSGSAFFIHTFASPWWAAGNIFYHAARDGRLWFSTDTGATWAQMAAPNWSMNRESFIRVGRARNDNGANFVLWYGDGFSLRHQDLTTATPEGTNAWVFGKNEKNPDPADVAHDVGSTRPILMAGDHGVYTTPDSGSQWFLTGSAFGGFIALQIGEVTGRAVSGNPSHLDLHYATQDNDIKASPDGGQTWNGSICCEGSIIRADARNPAAADDHVTGRRCGNCMIFLVAAHLAGAVNPFPNAPDGNPANPADPPLQTIGKTYLQQVPNTGPTGGFDYFLTSDLGTTWAPSFSVTRRPRGPGQFAGPLDNPIMYVAIDRGGFSPILSGLMRAENLASGASVRRADSVGMRSLGLLRTSQQTYVVFGADPAAPNHLLAPDIIDGQMKASSDGGITWYPLPNLTTAVTDTGKFLPQRKEQSLASTIAWDPTNSCHILVGTMQNGVIRSTDGGSTWKKIKGSDIVPWVSSFFFPPTGSIWMSSHGRGLWTISVDRRRPAGGRCLFPPPPGTVVVLDSLVVAPFSGAAPRPFTGLGDSLMCATCSLLVMQKGWVTEVELEGDRVREIAISNGSVLQLRRSGQEIPLTVPNVYRESAGANVRRIAGRAYTSERRVQGVILDGTRVVALVLGRDEIPIASAREPVLLVSSAGRSRIPSVAEAGDSVRVQGRGFVPGRGAEGVDILFDGEPVARGVIVGNDGAFSLTLLLRRGRGELEVTAQQRDGRRVTLLRTTITVVGREG